MIKSGLKNEKSETALERKSDTVLEARRKKINKTWRILEVLKKM